MDSTIALRTIAPILFLMALGFMARKIGVLKSGDERVLNAYVYYFALPALFLVNLAETTFTQENLVFVLAGITPIIIVVAVYTLIYMLFKFSKGTLYLLITSTVFGSLAFFGIPFVMFAFPGTGEHLATLSTASISVISVAISITVLELYRLEKSTLSEGVKRVAKRLSRNPLILSILFGVLLSLSGLEIPAPIADPLHMLGGTTSAVAVFLLGVFLYGRKYTNVTKALQLGLLRIVFLPVVGILVSIALDLGSLERAILVIMNSVPIALSMIILSERYDFYEETIATVILISSIGAGIYLNLWLLLLGY